MNHGHTPPLQGEIVDPKNPRDIRLTSEEADKMHASGEMKRLFRELPPGSHVICDEEHVNITIPDQPQEGKPVDIIDGIFHPVEKDPSKLISPKP